MATRKSTKKKTSNAKKTTKKVTKKNTTKKVVKRTTPKKVVSKKQSKPVKKSNTKKKITSSQTKAPATFRTTEMIEQETIDKLIREIRSLEQNNYQLAQQLQNAQTKREIITELKSYLADLRGNNSSNNNLYTPTQRTIEETSKQLQQAQERANNKDKLISKLKSLISGKQGSSYYDVPSEPEIETTPPLENLKHTYPGSVDSNWDEAKPIEVEVEESTPTITQEVKQTTNKNNKTITSTADEDDDSQEVTQLPEVDAKEVIEQKMAEIEEKKEVDKEKYQATTKRGVITIEEAQEYSQKLKDMEFEINKVFIGQEQAVKGVLISVLCSAHSLLEGVPGLAKTLLIETLGLVIDGTTFKRIQFLPDLLPSDIIGGQVFNPKTAEYTIYKGPIFANFVLADEINRAPPKTHAAIMEAMQEKKINIENETFILDKPFFVLATQNPLENKGTYELPEAVLDRFMFKLILDYPERKYELAIITENATTKDLKKNVKPVLTKQDVLNIQSKVKKVYISDKIREYIMDLVEATRGVNKNIEGMKFVKYGAGVRASIYLCLAAQANAVFEGRNYVLPDDVDAIAHSVLRHRVVVNYRGKAHNITPEKIVEEILSKVKAL
ncbi:MoxR family ATPase [Candidatus Woesearchaeota archaeon]|nr:MoxR family ATPase [Candidatus Woesearchaeota archaeon]